MTLRLVQITDTHLFADASGRLKGGDTEASLNAVIEVCRTHHPNPDLTLLTGDLSHDGSSRSYQRISKLIERLEVPVLAIPGNHDDISTMCQCGLGNERQRLIKGWNIVMLDTAIGGVDGGYLAAQELAFLDKALASQPNTPTLIGLHHHPIPVGSRWLDTIGLENSGDFFKVTDRYPQVRGIIFGHIHQEFASERNGALLLGAPATCIQFKPYAEEFCLDSIGPGYRWLELQPNGTITTGVVRITPC